MTINVLLKPGICFAMLAASGSAQTLADSEASGQMKTTPVVVSSGAPTGSGTLRALTPEQKFKRRVLRLIEPVTLLTSAAGAGIDQLRDVPPQWREGAEGYAKRFASSEGITAAHNTIALGFDLALHLDPRYRRMPEGKFKARLWNALSQTVIANKDGGGRMINVSEIAGNFGAGFIANAWEPEGYSSPGNGLSRGLLGVGFHALKNVTREFVPDLLHPGRRGAATAQLYAPAH